MDFNIRIIYIGQIGDKLNDIPGAHLSIDEVRMVRAGKFRRYNGVGWRQIFYVPTMLKNARDFGFVIIGIVQSYFLIRKLKPSIVFIRGGYVGVPVGLASAICRVPYVTHDSDAIPSLANRIIARWAMRHAVGLPKELYDYPQNKTVFVGVPVSNMFQRVTPKLNREYRQGFNISEDAKVICITGGGLGARRLNNAVAQIAPDLLTKHHNLHIFHIAGRDNEQDLKELYKVLLSENQLKHITVKGFVNDLYKYSAVADVIIARAGATNLAEFAVQGKACIIVPNPQLTGGHQIKNAVSLAKSGAIKVVNESELLKSKQPLQDAITNLLMSSQDRNILSEKLSEFAKPDSAKIVAELLIDLINKSTA